MRTRGFTLLELVTVLAINSVLVPSLYLMFRSFEDHQRLAGWTLEVATATRTLSESLRLDARAGKLAAGPAIRFIGAGPCQPVAYQLGSEGTLRREAGPCGATALATGVRSFERAPGGVVVDFGFERRPGLEARRQVFIAVGN